MGGDMIAPNASPEQNVRLPQGTPVYITYITATAQNGQIAFSNDVYSRDTGADRLASR